jgi:hypothetical protein
MTASTALAALISVAGWSFHKDAASEEVSQ